MKKVCLLIVILFSICYNTAYGTENDTSQVIDNKINTTINSNNLSSYKLKDNSSKILNWITALSTLSAVLASLYLGYWKEKFQKPKLKIEFSESKPYIQKIAFEPYNKFLLLYNAKLLIYRPGINVRIKVKNRGKTIARDVNARLEKIEFYSSDTTLDTKFYHPTDIKWSGQKGWKEVNIAPKSFFFLDALWVKNETLYEVYNFNYQRYRNQNLNINEEVLMKALENKIFPNKKIYWNTWVDCSFKRGIPTFYEFEGKFNLHIIINSSNCNPVSLILEINWEKASWDKPIVKVIKN
ncbi:hypothetical protein D4R71_01500 [bacterium]|nr:MAG: hypothetical protein D4R71_01500 [bacterium]